MDIGSKCLSKDKKIENKACLMSGEYAFIWADYVKLKDAYILLFRNGVEIIVENQNDLLFKGELQ